MKFIRTQKLKYLINKTNKIIISQELLNENNGILKWKYNYIDFTLEEIEIKENCIHTKAQSNNYNAEKERAIKIFKNILKCNLDFKYDVSINTNSKGIAIYNINTGELLKLYAYFRIPIIELKNNNFFNNYLY